MAPVSPYVPEPFHLSRSPASYLLWEWEINPRRHLFSEDIVLWASMAEAKSEQMVWAGQGWGWGPGMANLFLMGSLQPVGQVRYFKAKDIRGSNTKPAKIKNIFGRASLLVQWLSIHLPMQGTEVCSLVWEDPTCWGATRPSSHNNWAHGLQLLKPAHLQPMLHKREATALTSLCTMMRSPHSLQLEKAYM